MESGEIVGVFIGDLAHRAGAKGLWQSLQASVSAMCCMRSQIFGRLPQQVIPSSRHRVVGKDSSKTKGIER